MIWYVIPAILSVASLAAIQWKGGEAAFGFGYFVVCVAGYVVTTDWLLWTLRRRRPAPEGQGQLVAIRLLLGAPSAAWFLNALAIAVTEGDLAWDRAILTFIPVVLIWPVILVTLKGRDSPA